MVIFLLVLVFFGGEKMPEFARGLGKAIREFRKAASGVEQEFKRALEEEPAKTPPPATYPATSPNTILPPHRPTSAAPADSAPTSATVPATPAAPTPPPPSGSPYDPDSDDFHHAG